MRRKKPRNRLIIISIFTDSQAALNAVSAYTYESGLLQECIYAI